MDIEMIAFQCLLRYWIKIITLHTFFQFVNSHNTDVARFTARTDQTTGEKLCAMDKPFAVIKTRSALECSRRCSTLSEIVCFSFNFWTNNQTCDLFDFLPCSYTRQ